MLHAGLTLVSLSFCHCRIAAYTFARQLICTKAEDLAALITIHHMFCKYHAQNLLPFTTLHRCSITAYSHCKKECTRVRAIVLQEITEKPKMTNQVR